MDFSVVLLIILVAAIAFMFLYAIFSKPNHKSDKSCEYFEILNGSNNHNNGTPVASLYDKLSEHNIQLNYLKTK